MVTTDLLGSASLALAALAVIFGLWSADIRAASELPRRPKRADRDPDIATLRLTLKQKVLPLLIAAAAVAIALAPPIIGMILRSLANVQEQGIGSVKDYHAEDALFGLVWVMTLGLAVVMWRTRSDLKIKLRAFEADA